MNSAERVHAALRLQQPDRVPVVEFVVDEKVARLAVPGCRDVADCMDRLDMDGVGCGARFEPVLNNADGSYVDEWGVTYRPGPEAVAHPIRGPIRTLWDAKAYTPPDPDAPGRLGQLPELVERYRGRRAILFHHRAAFMWSAYLTGIDNILMNFLAEPETVEIVMDKVLECNMRIVRRAIRAGAEVIIMGDDYGQQSGADDESGHLPTIHSAPAHSNDRDDPRGRRRLHPHLTKQHPFLLRAGEFRRHGRSLQAVRPIPVAGDRSPGVSGTRKAGKRFRRGLP